MSDTEVDLENYDPMAREVQQCPFPHYAALRADAPAYLHPQTGMYFVSRLSTVNQVLRDTDTFSSHLSNAATIGSDEVMEQVREIAAQGWPRAETMLTIDPPAQTRYRKLVSRAFSARRIAALEPKVREITEQLVAGFPSSGSVDFHNTFSVALPVKVIVHALNMDPAREPDVKRWSDDAVAPLGANITDERRLEATRGVLECQQYWYSEYDKRLSEPQDDIITALVEADFEDADGSVRKLEFPEVFSILQQLMVAGNETTTKLLNESARLIIENDWFGRLKRDPSLIPPMVEEALRLASPNQGLFRKVTRDTELEGVPIPAGSRVWVMFGSANRDDATFADPDEFEPMRENLKEHVAFGKGHHFCIGAPLSRLEAKVAFEVLTEQLESIAFSDSNTFEYEPSYILRGLAALDLDVVRAS